jgi:peptidoglycan hydrolase-like protein with peptidoglycan-binding domain
MRDLKQGDTGEDVRELQDLLNHLEGGPPVVDVDGIFGPQTDEIIRNYQSSQGPDRDPAMIYTEVLVADGVVGPKTMRSLKTARELGPRGK